MKKDTVVVGIGNLLMSDEGIGVHLIERLRGLSDKYPVVEFVDGGTGGLSVLHTFCDRRKAIIIDCARMGTQPGTIKRFTPEDVRSVKAMSQYSLHETDLLKVIELAGRVGNCPEEIVIFGIEPQHIGPGQQLSRTIADSLDHYTCIISQELTQ